MENLNFLTEIPIEILGLGLLGVITLLIILKRIASILENTKKKPRKTDEERIKEYWTKERLDEYSRNQMNDPSY